MRFKHAVGHALKTIRTDNHQTLRELSTKSYVSLGFLSEIERGHKEPSLSTLESILKALNVSQRAFWSLTVTILEEQA